MANDVIAGYREDQYGRKRRLISTMMMAMKTSDFPSDLGAVVMSGGRELRFDVEVFSHLAHLESVTVRGVPKVYVKEHSLGVVKAGALNITVATVLMADNMFSHVHTRGVTLKEWNTLVISNNTFKRVEHDAFTSPSLPLAASRPGGPAEDYLVVTEEPTKAHEFNFTRNIMIEIHESAFNFPVGDDSKVLIDNNFFIFNCHCEMYQVQSLMSGGKAAMFDTGMCSIDETLSKCFQLPLGFVNMLNFTENICKVHGNIVCEEVQRDAAVPPNVPSITSAVDTTFDDVARERQILTSLFAIMLVGVLVVTIVSAAMWVGRKGYCAKARRFLLPSTNSFVDHLTRIFSDGGDTPTVSVSRLSVHEYAELQRKMEEAKTLEDDDYPLEDKATQTLPEELTQELLQSLKEKLNDPENYSEARDMIEHLYDLIKVEENCNKNNRESTCINVEDVETVDNVYDVIRPKRPAHPRTNTKPELVTQGTRAPSPDKLLPYSKRPMIVSDYMEPRDRKVHTYSEIPARPDLLPPAASQITTSISMANRPLPAEPTQL
ncbi:unnamed protein product [Nesidiocoris tenuis]|uniref:Uncharacterized protein n=1 Tax=Nesidiocoris tenuis TaxID=355587 RepID=A0A6H5H8N2_9HEMI|nr:unnamed protein product [Nesidiocoris tenuis]